MGNSLTILLLSLTLSASATDVYFAQTSAGSDTGADAANAHSVTWFNTYGNQVPGNTYHVVGTITTAVALTNSVTLLFESGAKFSKPAWSGVIIRYTDGVTVDGGANGLIESTDCGSSLTYKSNSTALYGENANNVVIRNLKIGPLYVRVSGGEQNDYGVGIMNYPVASAYGFTNVVVSNCVVRDAYQGISMDYGPGGNTNITVAYNVVSNVNWGIKGGDVASSSRAANYYVHHNTVGNFGMWDDTSLDSFHHNGVFFWCDQTGSTFGRLEVHHNYVYGFGTYNTSGFYFSANPGRSFVGPVYAYDNIFNDTVGNPSNGNMFFLVNDGFNGYVLNNTSIGNHWSTLVDWDTGYGGTQNLYVYNNIVSNNALVLIYNNAAAVIHSDYNSLYTLPGLGDWFSSSANNSAAGISFASWQATGNDTHSITNNPDLDANLVPNVTSPLIAAGTNLYSIFTTDYRGTNRVSSGAWDIGANTYTAGSGGGGGTANNIRIINKVYTGRLN